MSAPYRARLAAALAAVTDRPLEHWEPLLRQGRLAACGRYPAPHGVEVYVPGGGPIAGVSDAASTPRDLKLPGYATGRATLRENPFEAWELLATHGVIPLDWVGSAARVFYCDDCSGFGVEGRDGGPCDVCGGRGVLPSPATTLKAVLFAADVANVVTAEALVQPLLGYPARVCWRLEHGYFLSEAQRCVRLAFRLSEAILVEVDRERSAPWRELAALGYYPQGVDADGTPLELRLVGSDVTADLDEANTA